MNRNSRIKKRTENKSKKINIYMYLLILLAILFIYTLIDVIIVSSQFKKELNEMVEGKDYYKENIKIYKKDFETGYSSRYYRNRNYFFYYDSIKRKRMIVDEDTYKKYDINNKVPAYTMDHENYEFSKEYVLLESNKKYKNNEYKKIINVILGLSIIMYSLFNYFNRK